MNLKSKIKALEIQASKVPYSSNELIPGLLILDKKPNDPEMQQFLKDQQQKTINEMKGQLEEQTSLDFIVKKGKKIKIIKDSTESTENKEPKEKLQWYQKKRRQLSKKTTCGIIPLPSPMPEDDWEKYATAQQQELIERKRKELGE